MSATRSLSTPPVRGGDGVPTVDTSDRPASLTPIQDAMALLREYGPVVRRRRHGVDTLFVAGLDLATELADDERFAKFISPGLRNIREMAGDGLFTAYNDEPNWAKAHDILMPAFSLGSMRAYHPAMLRVCRRLLAVWDQRATEGVPVDVSDDMTRMTLDTIGLTGFGYDFGSFERDDPHPFVAALVRGLNWSMIKLGDRPGDDHSERDAAFRGDADFLASVVDEVIDARIASGDTSTDDLLGLMLQAAHPSDGTTLDHENIRNQVVTFLIAGHETTSGALAFALYFLLKNATVLRMVQRETDELWGDTDEPEPTYEDIGRLTFTRQVLNEALRLWPTAAVFSRTAREDTVLGGSIEVKAGQDVLIFTAQLHRQPEWGDNPELFDPSRFTQEAEAARSVHAYKPFGTGERACIGRQFALHEASMMLALLVHRYRLLDVYDYRLKVKEAITLKPEGLALTPVRRTTADRSVNRAAFPHRTTGAAGLPPRVRVGTRALFLHGSNYGSSRALSAQLADEAAALGCETAIAPLDNVVAALPTDRPVIITAASYNGRPTDDAAAFVTWLEGAAPGAAEGITYAVLGIGDRNWYATYQRVPTWIDARLAELGGTRLTDRAAADASGDLSGTVTAFTGLMRTALLTAYGDPATLGTAVVEDRPAYSVTEVAGDPLDALAARHELAAATVTEVRDLTAPEHGRVKRFVRLALPEGVGYRTADHIAVLPVNDPALVERAAAAFGTDPETVLSIAGSGFRRDALTVDRPLSVRELLAHHLELQDRPSPAAVGLLAGIDPCPPERAALEALAADPEALVADPRTLMELVEDNPALREVLTWPVLLELLPPIRTRRYSISSSPQDGPGQVDLMVSLLDAPARSGRGGFRGACSGYLNRVRPGDRVLVGVQPCREAFRVPQGGQDRRIPLILVGAGTGLAPFRGVLRDRALMAAEGIELAPALCYFGCDAPGADYLHADELHAAELAGAVSMRPAFSHAPVDGIRYVQHRIAAEADEVWKLLGEGARVRVCGDGSRMARGVREAFHELYLRNHPDAGPAGAREWFDAMVAQGRYAEDVHTG